MRITQELELLKQQLDKETDPAKIAQIQSLQQQLQNEMGIRLEMAQNFEKERQQLAKEKEKLTELKEKIETLTAEQVKEEARSVRQEEKTNAAERAERLEQITKQEQTVVDVREQVTKQAEEIGVQETLQQAAEKVTTELIQQLAEEVLPEEPQSEEKEQEKEETPPATEGGGTVSYALAVSALPEDAGTVDGGGTFSGGSNVTVGATANSGYSFVNWTEGQAVVSSEANYSFVISGNRTLVANFVVKAPATPEVTIWPTATAITYGQSLSISVLSGGEASVSGTFAFAAPSTVPPVGTVSHTVIFTPEDIVNYTTASGSVSVTVIEAGAAVTLDDLEHTYDGTPKRATAVTNPSGLNVNITYNGSTEAPVDAGSYAVAATIEDDNYMGTATGTLVIDKATPAVTTWPAASEIVYGQTLADSTLSGGETSVSGTFAFADPDTAPFVGTASHAVIFIPADTVDYYSVSGSVNVTVQKAQGPPAPTRIGKTDETFAGLNDGTLTGTASGQKYQVNGEGEWIPITDTTVTGLAPGSYVVRFAATSTHFAGAATEPLVIAPGIPAPEAVGTSPVVANVNMTSADVLVEYDKAGTACYIVVSAESVPPTAAQVKAETGYGEPQVTIFSSGSSTLDGEFKHTFNITGLAPGTAYKVYAVAENPAGLSAVTDKEIYTAVMPEMGGSVSITGITQYGEILTADISELIYTPSTADDQPTYEWFRDGELYIPISGATDPTYILAEEDIGLSIRVIVTADGVNAIGSVTSTPTATVTKAANTTTSVIPAEDASAPPTADTITLTDLGATYEYAITDVDGTQVANPTWQASMIFTGLDADTAYKFRSRIAETATHLASAPSAESAAINTVIEYISTNDLDNPSVAVAYGTSEEDALAALDAAVGIQGTEDKTGVAAIQWSIAGYNGNVSGSYTATGVLTLPAGWLGNPENVTAMLTVGPASSDATVVAVGGHYLVDNLDNTIVAGATPITTNVTVGTFLGNLSRHAQAQWKVVAEGTAVGDEGQFAAAAGKGDSATLIFGDQLAVRAEDSTIKVYSIEVVLGNPVLGGGSHPGTPSGLKSAYPGFTWGLYRYWVYDFTDNRCAIMVVAYDQSNQIVQQWEKSSNNSRYIKGIDIDTATNTIIFSTDQPTPGTTITVPWNDFLIPQPPVKITPADLFAYKTDCRRHGRLFR